jgi:hypothetical protein
MFLTQTMVISSGSAVKRFLQEVNKNQQRFIVSIDTEWHVVFDSNMQRSQRTAVLQLWVGVPLPRRPNCTCGVCPIRHPWGLLHMLGPPLHRRRCGQRRRAALQGLRLSGHQCGGIEEPLRGGVGPTGAQSGRAQDPDSRGDGRAH